MPDKYVQSSVCFASAVNAGLAIWPATRRFASASSGITINDAIASTIPGRLSRGASRETRD